MAINKIDQLAWLRETKLGIFRSREPELLAIDINLDRHIRLDNKDTITQLDWSVRAYKKAVQGWERSGRNNTRIMSRTFQLIQNDMELYLEKCGCVWSPIHEEETLKNARRSFTQELGLHPIWQGGDGDFTDLSKFSVNSTIYLLAHGHSEMSVFKINKRHFTPKQFVDLLIKDKIRFDHKNFIMLVCHAGQSVNTKKSGNALWEIQQSNNEANAAILRLSGTDVDEMERLKSIKKENLRNWTAAFNDASNRKPEMFESFSKDDIEKQLLPLAAELSSAMKISGFTNFALRSFKAPVQNIVTNLKICLDLTYARSKFDARLQFSLPAGHQWNNVPVDLVPEWEVIWR